MRIFIAVFIVAASASIASAQDWSQWRGPARDGVIPAAVIPKQWPSGVKKGWSVEIGEGYSSPVVVNGLAFVHSRRDPEELVTAIDLATGKVVWQQKYTSEFKKNQYAAHRRFAIVHAWRDRNTYRLEHRRRLGGLAE